MKAPRDPSDPNLWLARARSDLELAQSGRRPGVFLEDLCFHAQQAAEKALKAVCVARGIDFPRTHSLILLMDLIEAAGLEIPPEVKAADVLTHYAVQARYPDWLEEVTAEEYRTAISQARGVVEWAASVLAGRR